MTVVETIQARIVELEEQMNEIKSKAEKEQRLLAADELETLEKSKVEHSDLTRQVNALSSVAAARAASSEPQRITRPALSLQASLVGERKGLNGFRTVDEFYSAVRKASTGRFDNRLLNAASDTSTEATDADGGYAVPDDARRDIWSYVLGQGSLLPMTDQYNSFSNVLTFPKDTVQGDSSQYVAAWTAETGSIAEKKLALGTVSVTAHKLTVAINASDELLEDGAAMQTFISRKAGEAFQYAVNKAIFSGTGTGQPKGAIVGNQYSKVASGTWSASGTVTAGDIQRMYFRMPPEERSSAVWVINGALEPVLAGLVISGTTVPAYLPPGGLSASPYATLLGRPVMVHPDASIPGTPGDISFINFKRYLALVKGPGIRSDVSMHVYFLNDVQTFRFKMRLGGTAWLDAVPTIGGVPYSPFVGLAKRDS